jgi:hypothetical protein
MAGPKANETGTDRHRARNGLEGNRDERKLRGEQRLEPLLLAVPHL